MYLLRFGFLSILGSWTRHFTLTMWNFPLGIHKQMGSIKVAVWVKVFHSFAARVVDIDVGQTFLVTGSKKKLDQLGSVCINLNSNTSFKQSLRIFKHNWNKNETITKMGCLGAVHLVSYLNRIMWLPTLYVVGQLKGLLEEKAQGEIYSPSKSFFLFPQPKEEKMMWDQSPL